MSIPTILKLWHDAALTTAIDTDNPLELEDGIPLQIYVGSDTNGYIHERISDPGVDQLQVSIVDADAGSGAPASNIKLALSEAELSGAVGGNAVNLGTSILSGVANAVPVSVLGTDSGGVVANYTDLSLAILDVQDTAL